MECGNLLAQCPGGTKFPGFISLYEAEKSYNIVDMKRTDLLDTSVEMHRAQVLLIREKGPEWRVQKTMQLCDESREAYPEQTKKTIRRFAKVS